MKAINTTRRIPWPALVAAAALAAVALLLALWPATPAQAHSAQFYLDCVGTVANEGDHGRVVVVRSHTHNRLNLYAAWFHTDPGTADASDYHNLDNVYQQSESNEAWKGRMGRNIHTKEDHYPELDETFTVRTTPTDSLAPGRSNSCEMTIRDDDGVGIYDLEIISSPADGRAYRAGEDIEILARFNGDVTGEKPVLLSMNMSSSSSWWRGAHMTGKNDDRNYVFSYSVQPGDMDLDGISVLGTWADGGVVHGLGGIGSITVRDTGEPINPWFRGLDDDPAHKVDGRPYATGLEVISTPASQGHYRPGETIEIAMTFNQAVEVEGHVLVGLRVGTGSWWRGATYRRGSGSDTLVFGYDVQQGDSDDNGISMDGGFTADGVTHSFGGSGAIKAAGTDIAVNPHYPGLPHDPAHKVDGVTPVVTVTDVSVTSEPGTNGTYRQGEPIVFTVTFSANVSVDDVSLSPRPKLTFDLDFDSRDAFYHREGLNDNQITFAYVVNTGDFAKRGIVVGENSLSHNGGAIRGPSGYPADLSHDALPTLGGHIVDAPGGL